jgi:arylsulfatase A-like enzyme
MAMEGVRCTNFYSASSVCSPSRCALLTGRYPIRSGVVRVLFPGEPFGIPDSEITIAELLKDRHYATACVGKWHLGDLPPYLPNRHGFDHFFGLHYSNDMDPSIHKRKLPYPLALYRNGSALPEPVRQDRLTGLYTEESIAFIRRKRRQPFFLYLAHSMPHWPWASSSRFRGRSDAGAYGDSVQELDASVGRILDTLREEGLDSDTLVIFTSDNGADESRQGGTSGPFRGAKFSTWDGGFREPFIARWPGTLPSGVTRFGMASTIDLFTTFAFLAQGSLPQDRPIDGLDLFPFLRDGGPSPRNDYLFFDSPFDSSSSLCAVRQGPWKLHFRKPASGRPPSDPTALFNIAIDPPERFDRLKEQPAIAARLLDFARRAVLEMTPGSPCPPLKDS